MVQTSSGSERQRDNAEEHMGPLGCITSFSTSACHLQGSAFLWEICETLYRTPTTKRPDKDLVLPFELPDLSVKEFVAKRNVLVLELLLRRLVIGGASVLVTEWRSTIGWQPQELGWPNPRVSTRRGRISFDLSTCVTERRGVVARTGLANNNCFHPPPCFPQSRG